MKSLALNRLNSAGVFGLLLWCLAVRAVAGEPTSLDPQLEPLRPLLGKTWRGQFKGSTPDKPMVDVMRWERALNGKAIRVLHSINDGAYGGETLFLWDEAKKSVTYYYFTTAGFRTVGTMKFEGPKIITIEKVEQAGATTTEEVRGTSELRSDGSLHVKTEHLKDGQWSPGHEVIYREAPEATVRFK